MLTRRLILAVSAFCLCAFTLNAQSTFSTAGSWSTSTNWTPNGVPSGTGTDVQIDKNVTVSGGDYVIGNVTLSNNNSITVNSGSSLTIGAGSLTTNTYSTPGTTSYTFPSGKSSIKVTVVGGGGGGAASTGTGSAGGGGGGGAAAYDWVIFGGSSYSYTVGSGGSTGNNGGTSSFTRGSTTEVSAAGGTKATGTSGGAGGSTGTGVVTSGSTGGNGATDSGAGGNAASPGGSGGAARTTDGVGINGTNGGGGSGGRGSTNTGGTGGDGLVQISYGTVSTKKDLTLTQQGSLTIAGTLEIWGDLIIGNGLTLNLTGRLIIHGNMTAQNQAQITVTGTGTLALDGNLSTSNQFDANISGGGSFGVVGTVSVGNGSSVTGGGTITSGGGCSGPSGFCNSVTPIELVYFKAEPTDSRVTLKWATLSEDNFDYFSIERSREGIDFSEIGQVKGSGTSNTRKDYSFIDENPLVGRSYYRLKSVDFDLYTETFKIISVNSLAGKSVSIYPNPVSAGKLNVDLNFQTTEELTARVTDLMGTEVGTYKLNALSNTFDVDLKPGSYVVRVYSETFSSVSRFVVR